ncbi:MAG: LamG-like jellyroll fold domain-containing protein [Bacteroidota bacterium]
MKVQFLTLLLAVWTSMAFGQLPPYAAHYKLNGSGIDQTTNQNHGTVIGPSQAADHNNIYPQAYNFDGIDDYITLNPNNQFQESLPLSIVAWVNIEDSDFNMVFKNEYVSNRYSGVWLNINTSRKVAAGYGDGGFAGPSSRRSKVGTTSLALNTWYHVAVVIRSATDMDIYINGQNDCGTYSGTGGPLSYISNATGGIGVSDPTAGNGGEEFFNGRIDEVRFFNGALSNADVLTLYGLGGGPSSCCDISAYFTWSASGSVVSFNNLSTGNASLYEWDFGDNSSGVYAAPQTSLNHTYSGPGVYTVCLTAIDSRGDCYDSYCEKIYVRERGDRTRIGEEGRTWTLYPNPAADKVQIQWAERSAEPQKIKIMDVSGRVVKQELLPQGSSAKIDLAELPNGVYIIEIEGSEQREKLQIIH